MTLKVIGAGWGRTGTTSLKLALEKLGFGPCYHWAEVRPEDVPRWMDAADGKPVDWDALFEGFTSAVDWPASHFYAQLADRYPDAKVVLTSRDPDRWLESARETIFAIMSRPLDGITGNERPGWDAESLRGLISMSRRVIIEEALGARLEERIQDDAARIRERFEAHLAEVERTIPKERLLHFQVREGWAPLCSFLDVPVPDEPFPRVNQRRSFTQQHGIEEAE